MAKCTCPTCDGRGEVVGKYVICEHWNSGVLAEGDTIEDVLPHTMTVAGVMIEVSRRDREKAWGALHDALIELGAIEP